MSQTNPIVPPVPPESALTQHDRSVLLALRANLSGSVSRLNNVIAEMDKLLFVPEEPITVPDLQAAARAAAPIDDDEGSASDVTVFAELPGPSGGKR